MEEEDRITAPTAPREPTKQKDPKTVAAGRALAARNKAARKALAREQDHERDSEREESHRASTSWSSVNWGILIATGSLLVSLYSLYLKHTEQPPKRHQPPAETQRPAASPRRIME